jgi:hypothetical protein
VVNRRCSMSCALFEYFFAGDHVLLEYEDLCNVDCPRYVTVRTVTVSGQESQDSPRALLSQQLIQDLTAGLLSTSQVD